MEHTRRLERIGNLIFNICLSAALIFSIACAFSCSKPLPDLDKIGRSQFSRVATDSDGLTCQSWLPLVLHVEIGQGLLATALAAAQPWSDSLGFAVAVPAKEGERATVEIVLEDCPAKYVTDKGCKRWAQIRSTCDAGVLYQTIEVFHRADKVTDFFVIMHELGHALGVDLGGDHGHNPEPTSIMHFQVAMPDKALEAGAVPQWIQQADVVALRSAWRAPAP